MLFPNLSVSNIIISQNFQKSRGLQKKVSVFRKFLINILTFIVEYGNILEEEGFLWILDFN